MLDIKEETRRRGLLIIAHAAWWGALGLTILHVLHITPRNLSIVVVLLIGVGISSGLSLSRARLTDAIVGSFHAGLIASQQSMEEVAARFEEPPPSDGQRDQQDQQEA